MSFTEFTLEGWPVPDSWNDARETLLEKDYATRPLNAYLHGKTDPIRPSRYERRLKGAIAHVSFIFLAFKFDKEQRIRFSAIVRQMSQITVLERPKKATARISVEKRKEKDATAATPATEPPTKKAKLSLEQVREKYDNWDN
ncbi:hypothetical protein JOM56_015681 [Amanita muscaria]